MTTLAAVPDTTAAAYAEQLRLKVERVTGLLAGFNPPAPQIIPSATSGFRVRAEFRIWHEGADSYYAMFNPGDPRTPLRVETFPIASATIQQLMPTLRERVLACVELRRKLFQIEFLSTQRGNTLVSLIYHRRLDTSWEAEATQLAAQLGVSIIGRSRKQKVIIGEDFVTEALEVGDYTYRYRQQEQSFTQPNAGVNEQMLAWACAAAAGLGGDLLELYCGNGNFTLPLSRHFDRVIATELSKSGVRDALHNLAANHITNVHVVRLAAQEVSSALNGEREFRRLAPLPQPLQEYALHTLFVDPPRAGLDAATLATAQRFRNILYISCNPETLVQNLHSLAENYTISRFGLFDQFPYSEHMECGVLLRRRNES